MVLHISYSATEFQPNHLDKEVIFDGKTYEIVAATYFGRSHLKLRYFFRPNVYELEEGKCPDLGDRGTSIAIPDDYEKALPGSFADVEGSVRFQIHDVFYRRRPNEYQEESFGLKRSIQCLEEIEDEHDCNEAGGSP
jgi:hypothetical protein